MEDTRYWRVGDFVEVKANASVIAYTVVQAGDRTVLLEDSYGAKHRVWHNTADRNAERWGWEYRLIEHGKGTEG